MTAAIVLFAFGVGTALASLYLPLGTMHAQGSGFFPLLLGLILAALSATQAVSLYMARLRQAPVAAAPTSQRLGEGTRRVLLFLGAAALAIALLPILGYGLTSLVLMLALLRILSVGSWPLIAAISGATAAACYILFVRVLGIPLPAGWLGF